MTVSASSSFSSNEIEQLCLKAARGAGLSWGLAEEAGVAAAWLVSQGIDGPEILLHLLRLGPLAGPTLPWRAQSLLQCPIRLGASLCDHADLPQTDLAMREIELGFVAMPLLLLPFLSRMAGSKHNSIELHGAGPRIILQSGESAVTIAQGTPIASQAHLRISRGAEQPKKAALRHFTLSLTTIDALNIFAMRTTVPASEASRAGAGASDRDID